MEFTGLRMTLIVAVFLTAVAIAVFLDQLRKQRQPPLTRSIKPFQAPRAQRPIKVFYAPPGDYAPAKKVAATAIDSVLPNVKMASPSPATPLSRTEEQLPAITIDQAIWDRLTADHSGQKVRSLARHSANTIEATNRMILDEVPDLAPAKGPRGMILLPELEELIKNQEPFTGLVISVGINESDSSVWHSRGLMQSVGNYIAGLLGEKDFSSRISYDEFVMVCPGERGAQSQRRLNQISELIWEYQLGGICGSPILLNWGGVQVQDQPLSEAIASATERMRETKRSGHSAQSALAHRQVI